MNKAIVSVAAVAAMLALGACASQDDKKMEAKMAKPTTMTAPELAKAFAKGSKQCNVVLADGTKAEDFYYKNKTATSGDLDRNIGSTTKQGSWKILGPAFYVKLSTKKKALGTWMKLEKTGKKSFNAYNSAGAKVMSMKCK
jgi:hypothetical protein